jgi:hypothetical protein
MTRVKDLNSKFYRVSDEDSTIFMLTGKVVNEVLPPKLEVEKLDAIRYDPPSGSHFQSPFHSWVSLEADVEEVSPAEGELIVETISLKRDRAFFRRKYIQTLWWLAIGSTISGLFIIITAITHELGWLVIPGLAAAAGFLDWVGIIDPEQ